MPFDDDLKKHSPADVSFESKPTPEQAKLIDRFFRAPFDPISPVDGFSPGDPGHRAQLLRCFRQVQHDLGLAPFPGSMNIPLMVLAVGLPRLLEEVERLRAMALFRGSGDLQLEVERLTKALENAEARARVGGMPTWPPRGA